MTIDRLGSLDPLRIFNKADKKDKLVPNNSMDSIEVSSEAKAQAELLALRETIRNTPEVRMERVNEIKTKLQDPNFIDDKILESTAENILKAFGI